MDMMKQNENALRNIPQVEKILQDERMEEHRRALGHPMLVSIVREEVERFRTMAREEPELSIDSLYQSIAARCRLKALEKLQRVINGTGVFIHTNLGRAPLNPEILRDLASALRGYVNLEYHIPTRKRGRRGGFAEEVLCRLTGAEDAIIVNNNAAAVFLMLNEFCPGREVIVSRGELVQIGGGFRIPEIMQRSGSRLVEVGTTNISTLDDYRGAITGETAMILSVHRSNFAMSGFTESPSLKELATLKSESVLFARDLGSGNLVRDDRLPRPFEPDIAFELSQGADLLCFSGDKLLGGCQAGMIVGRKELIARLRKNQLMRILRVDKVTYFILQETLLAYSRGAGSELPVWSMVLAEEEAIRGRINRLLGLIGPPRCDRLKTVPMASTFGGGAMPGEALESLGIEFDLPEIAPDIIHDFLLTGTPPVVGLVADGRYRLDCSTVFDGDLADLAARIGQLFDYLGV